MRVSTEEQVKEGYSLQSQKRKLLAYCESKDWNVAGIYEDEGISGSTLEKRPQAMRMLDDLKKGVINHILILKVDRLCRNTRNLLEIVDLCKKYNAKLSAVEEQIDYTTPTGKMMLTMLGSFAELERSTISSRMMSGKEQKVRNGLYLFGKQIPYGYKREGDKLVPNIQEAQQFLTIVQMYLKGYSLNKICTTLRDNGVRSKYDSIFQPSVIAREFRNPVYKGYAQIRRKNCEPVVVKATNIEAIMTEDEWNNLNAILNSRTSGEKKPRKYASSSFYFSSVMYCATCGRKMQPKYNPNRNYYRYYLCKYAKKSDVTLVTCTNKGLIRNETVENNFLEYIRKMNLNTPLDDFKQETKRYDYSKEIDSLKLKKSRLLDIYLEGNIGQMDYNEKVKELDYKLNSLQLQMQEIENEAKQKEISDESMNELRKLSKDIISVWSIMDDQEKKNFVESNVKRIEYSKIEGIVNILWNI